MDIKDSITVNHEISGLTLVEMLIVIAIMATLVALLVPALNTVRRIAKETKQKAQFTTIELALTAFKNDYGDYPPSDASGWKLGDPLRYCGAQKLSEALVGADLLGFHPQSTWDLGARPYGDPDLSKRKGPYLEQASTNAFQLGITREHDGLFDFGSISPPPVPVAADTFVLCDVFGVKPTIIPGQRRVYAGAPILYYRANTTSKNINASAYEERIYNCLNNFPIIALRRLADWKKPFQFRLLHKIGYRGDGTEDPELFYNYIRDPKVQVRPWPYRPDSYILISAGADGLYGTSDDIRNFGN